MAVCKPGKMNAGSVSYFEKTAGREEGSGSVVQFTGTDMVDYYSEHNDLSPKACVHGRDADAEARMVEALGIRTGDELSGNQVRQWFNESLSPTDPEARLGQRLQKPRERVEQVRDDQGRVVLDEQTGEPLTRTTVDGGSVLGWDLMTAASKTVSIAYGIADDADDTGQAERVRAACLRAQERSVAAALRYMAEHAAYVRSKGEVHKADGIAGVTYLHKTSRAGDPHLHHHALVHNRVLYNDRWYSIDGKSFMAEAKTAGCVADAVARASLHRDLGWHFTGVDPHVGTSDATGVDRETIQGWSRRSSQIAEWCGAHGVEGDAAEATGQKATRDDKDLSKAAEDWHREWAARAKAEGMDWRSIGAAETLAVEQPREVDPEQVLRTAVERHSTVTRSEVARVAAAMLPYDAEQPDAVLARVEALTDAAVATGVKLDAASKQGDFLTPRRSGRESDTRYTTQDVLDLELSALDNAGTMDPDLSTDPSLVRETEQVNGPQRDTLRDLVAGETVGQVVEAPAGAGKTTSLRAARLAWEADGRRVLGIAPTGKAAGGMQTEGAVSDASTIASVLGKIQRGEGTGWRRGDIVVMDEAGMVGSLTLARMLSEAKSAGARLVMVGDRAQLQAVKERSGLYSLLADSLPNTTRLNTVHRQRDRAEAAATLGLRASADDEQRDRSIDWYVRNGRIQAGDQHSMMDAAYGQWQTANDRGRSAAILCNTWETADGIAAAAQKHRLERGQVTHRVTVPLGHLDPDTGETLSAEGHRRAGVGDYVQTLRNDYRLRTTGGDSVRNGYTWRVEKIVTGSEGDASNVLLQRLGSEDDPERAWVPASYLSESGRLGYALTVHNAQGATVDEGVALLDGQTTGGDLAYVAMTRGRASNHAYIVEPDTHGHAEHDTPPKQRTATQDEAREQFAAMLDRDRQDRAAHTVVKDNAREADTELAERYDAGTVHDFKARAARTGAGKAEAAIDAKVHALHEKYAARQAERATDKDRGRGIG